MARITICIPQSVHIGVAFIWQILFQNLTMARFDMKKSYKFVLALSVVTCSMLPSQGPAHAISCGDYTQSPSSSNPSSITILDTDIGTEAYLRLIPYSSGGHRALGMAIAAKFNYFDNCEYVGIGIGDGSGGNGYRPNYTLWMWRDGVNVDIARAAIYELVGASTDPVVTNGDCNISCDGTVGRQFDGSISTTSTSSTTTTTTTTIPISSNNDSSTPDAPIQSKDGAKTSQGTSNATTETVINVLNAAISFDSAIFSPQISKVKFKNCNEVNRVYPWGVAKTLAAAKKQKQYKVNSSYISASLYKSLSKMDHNKDLTACE